MDLTRFSFLTWNNLFSLIEIVLPGIIFSVVVPFFRYCYRLDELSFNGFHWVHSFP